LKRVVFVSAGIVSKEHSLVFYVKNINEVLGKTVYGFHTCPYFQFFEERFL
jgi:hypothetical protein